MVRTSPYRRRRPDALTGVNRCEGKVGRGDTAQELAHAEARRLQTMH